MEARYPLAEARNKLSDLVAEVESTHERITITKHGRDAAVLISRADLDEMEATIELLSADDERSEVLKALRRAQADLAAGKISTLDDLAESLKRRGISTTEDQS
jgi:antitoxin YefM